LKLGAQTSCAAESEWGERSRADLWSQAVGNFPLAVFAGHAVSSATVFRGFMSKSGKSKNATNSPWGFVAHGGGRSQ